MPISQTLTEFIIERQHHHPGATGEFTRLLGAITTAAKIVNREVNKAGLVDILGAVGAENVQGEAQQKLDVYANRVFAEVLQSGGECRAIASEEEEEVRVLDGPVNHSKYLVAIDPLDGSGNIDVNVSIGTIFAIYRREDPMQHVTDAEFLIPGRELVASGYVLYGSSTMLVYTSGSGVNGFTLDPSIGEFCLSHPQMQMPELGQIYSMNEGNLNDTTPAVQQYIHLCQQRRYKARYIGSLVADFHRNLLKGGIYLYPATAESPRGKLRLLYECNPLAFLVEQAGGLATDGENPILDLQPEALHQRVPLIIGSKQMVQDFLALRGADNK